jgi:hypothetical protein
MNDPAEPHPDALWRLFWFQDEPPCESPELLARELSLAASRVKAQQMSHPRFPPEQIKAMTRREIRAVTDAIKAATRHLQMQADHLEQTR